MTQPYSIVSTTLALSIRVLRLRENARSVVRFEGVLTEAALCVAYAPVDLDGQIGIVVGLSPRGIRARLFGCTPGPLHFR